MKILKTKVDSLAIENEGLKTENENLKKEKQKFIAFLVASGCGDIIPQLQELDISQITTENIAELVLLNCPTLKKLDQSVFLNSPTAIDTPTDHITPASGTPANGTPASGTPASNASNTSTSTNSHWFIKWFKRLYSWQKVLVTVVVLGGIGSLVALAVFC